MVLALNHYTSVELADFEARFGPLPREERALAGSGEMGVQHSTMTEVKGSVHPFGESAARAFSD